MAASAGAIRAGKAFVEIYGDDSKLSKTIANTRAKMRGLAEGMQKLGAPLAAVGGAMTASLGLAVKSFTEAGDALDKMAGRTGVSVESLSALKFAAEQSGASLEDVEGGIKGMQTVLRNADRGLSRATENLGALGLKIEDLRGLSPEQQFRKFADAISRVEDPSQRAALAMQTLGGAGQKLLPLLANGAQGLDAYAAQAERLGLVMTAEQAAQAAQLGDAINEVSSAAFAAKLQIGAALAPALTDLAKSIEPTVASLAKFIKQNPELIQQLGAIAIGATGVGTGMLAAGAAINTVSNSLSSMANLAKLAGGNLKLLGAAGAVAGIAAVAYGVHQANEAIREFNKQLERSNELQGRIDRNVQAKQNDVLRRAATEFNPAQRDAFLKEQLERAQTELQGKKFQVGLAESEFERQDTNFNALTGNKLRELAANNLADRKAEYAQASEFVERLKSALAGPARGLPAAVQDFWTAMESASAGTADKFRELMDEAVATVKPESMQPTGIAAVRADPEFMRQMMDVVRSPMANYGSSGTTSSFAAARMGPRSLSPDGKAIKGELTKHTPVLSKIAKKVGKGATYS